MANILSISSQVVYGAIGNSIASFALQRLGHRVWQTPTTVLSNHPGHGQVDGRQTSAEEIAALWKGIKHHGWHRNIDAVLTGYMPSAPVTDLVATVVEEARRENPKLIYLCDPVIGDIGEGRYVDEAVAVAIRDQLVPLADTITPNLFELSWLASTTVDETAADIDKIARQIRCPNVVTTSVTGGRPDTIENVLCATKSTVTCATRLQTGVPKGTGDLFSAVLLAHWLEMQNLVQALASATAIVETVLSASLGQDTLRTVETQDAWTTVCPTPIHEMKA